MNLEHNEEYDVTLTESEIQDELLANEILLREEDDFLKIKETLTRIGVASFKDKTIWQSCHILHKQGRYYIVHFKELFVLDGKPTTLSWPDILRRNAITDLLFQWDLCDPAPAIVDTFEADPSVLRGNTMIIRYNEKDDWNLKSKHSLGRD